MRPLCVNTFPPPIRAPIPLDNWRVFFRLIIGPCLPSPHLVCSLQHLHKGWGGGASGVTFHLVSPWAYDSGVPCLHVRGVYDSTVSIWGFMILALDQKYISGDYVIGLEQSMLVYRYHAGFSTPQCLFYQWWEIHPAQVIEETRNLMVKFHNICKKPESVEIRLCHAQVGHLEQSCQNSKDYPLL